MNNVLRDYISVLSLLVEKTDVEFASTEIQSGMQH